MQLKEIFSATPKAELQGFYLHWCPGKEMLSDRERIASELQGAMADHLRVRQRFDSLPRAQQGFLRALLLRDEHAGTVEEVRSHRHGRTIEDFEVENVLKGLQEAGYISRLRGTGGYSREVFGIPDELAGALKRTVAVEERQPAEMLSLRAHLASLDGGRGEVDGLLDPASIRRRVESLEDAALRGLVGVALAEHGGILTHSHAAQAGMPSFSAPHLRRQLESSRLGTTGVLSLKDCGIDLEEEGLFLFQEVVYELSLSAARDGQAGNDKEVSLGADLIIDLDRALEVLRHEPLEVTREGNVYKKIEERIASQFVTSHHPEFHDGPAVHQIFDLSRRLRFFDDEEHRIVVDPLRRRTWRKKDLLHKVGQVFDIFLGEKRGQRWSFHQTAIREIFLDHARRIAPGSWLIARPFLTAIVARYLVLLDEGRVRDEFHARLTGDFRNETLVVSVTKLHHDLSYWVLHRLALLGLVDVGYRDGAFHSLRLSRLGAQLLESRAAALEPDPTSGARAAPAGGGEAGAAGGSPPPLVLVNPDFEILMYPDAPEEWVWLASLFADRLDSDHVKRYRLSRESVKRGIVAGLGREEIIQFLETSARGQIPPNVVFSLREWTEGVELVRQQKVILLRSQSPAGAGRLAEILEEREVPYERLNETTIMVRGQKNERAVKELQEHFRDAGLIVE
jgi:XPB/Ssl2-like helicase family protein